MKLLKAKWGWALLTLAVTMIGTTFIYEGVKGYIPSWNPIMSIFIGVMVLIAGAIIGLKVFK